MSTDSANYDPFAWVYNRHWGAKTPGKFLPILKEHLLADLSPPKHLLDLCCGTGQLDHALQQLGYTVTGVDASSEMINFARANAPACEFIVADVREFSSSAHFDAALCMYDSLNHLLSLADLQDAFVTIRRVLNGHAPFLFDLNTGASFRKNWNGSFGIVENDLVCVIRPSFSEQEQLAEFRGTIMRPEIGSGWRRSDIHLTQRCYPTVEVVKVLSAAGFSDIRVLDLGVLSTGKDFFHCRAA